MRNKLSNTELSHSTGFLFINTEISLVVKYLERLKQLTTPVTPSTAVSYRVYYIIISLPALFCPLYDRPRHAPDQDLSFSMELRAAAALSLQSHPFHVMNDSHWRNPLPSSRPIDVSVSGDDPSQYPSAVCLCLPLLVN